MAAAPKASPKPTEPLIFVEEQRAPVRQLPTVPADVSSLMKIIDRAALDPTFDVVKLKELLDVKERWEANEARKAFVVAMAAFKANPPTLTKNKHVQFETSKGDTEYFHATLDQVSGVIGAALSPHGISHRWDTEQLEGGLIRVTCVLTHVLGHSERTPLMASPDQSGGKNNIQAIGSTVSYLQRYTLLAATGMAVKGMDDDGAGGRSEDGMKEAVLVDHLSAIDGAADESGLKKAFGVAWNAAEKLKDKYAMKKLTEHKDARKKALGVRS